MPRKKLGRSKIEVTSKTTSSNCLGLVQQQQQQPQERINDFDDILAIIGSKGRYQKLLLYAVVSPTIAMIPLIGFNALFIHGEQDHWCYQPETEVMNPVDLMSWKNVTLPLEIGPDGNQRFSQCKMYNVTGNNSKQVIDCPAGWSYNRTDLRSTVVSDYNWVCARNGYLTLLYTFSAIGGLLANIVFGPLADKFGRKPIYFIGFTMALLFGFLSLFTPANYPLYISLNFLAATGSTGEMLTLILAELCDDEFRSWSCSWAAAIWVLGMCATPYIAYWAQDWFTIGLATYIPCFFLLLYVFVLPESPRWLISAGRTKEAARIIQQIAKINGTSEYIEDDKLHDTLEMLSKTQKGSADRNGTCAATEGEMPSTSTIPRFWSLFTNLNVLKITILLTIESVGSGMLYSGITLNTPNLAGNQFFNFFLLALIEFPSSFLAGYLVRTLGRRWTLVFAFFLSGIACVTAAAVVGDQTLTMIVTVAVIVTKFTINITYVGLSLQQCELFPTPFRSTGRSIVAVVAGVISLLTPSMVYLGKFYAAGPYFAMAGLALLSSVAASFLPETLNQTLPETIEQSNEFGKGDKFWSIKPRRKSRSIKYSSLRKNPVRQA